MSTSTLSVTDVDVFKRLSNPLVVDVKEDAHTKAALQMQNAIDKAAKERSEENSSSALKFAQDEEEREEKSKHCSPKSPKSPLPRSPTARASTPKADENTAESKNENGAQDDKLEKQGYLIELSNLKQKGIELSREFTINDTLEELEFEVSKQNNNINTRNSVAFMRDMLRIIINGLEISNNRFGPFLSINGWSESCTEDMQKYEHCLEKIYKLYFRRSQMSPVMELAWLIFGSMIAWHFKSKFFGPAVNQTVNPPKNNNSSFNEKSAAQNNTRPLRRNMTQKSGRSVLRPPNFGI